MKKQGLDESIIALNASETKHNENELALGAINLKREAEKLAFEEAQDYRHGMLVFSGEIDTMPVLALSGTLRRLARLRPGKPIRVEFNSNGGHINDGLHLIDDITIIGKDCPITIVVRGQAASMAAVIVQAAQHRIIGPNSYMMLHRASFGVEGSADSVEDTVAEVKMFEQRIYEIVAKRTKKTVDFWKKQLGKRKDVWYTAEEAVKIGLADEIG